MAKIDNKKVAEVIASYAVTGSYNATAKELGISDKTVKKIILENPKKYEEKKETFIQKADRIIDKAMNKLEKKIDKEDVAASQLTTVIGTLVDKKRLVAGESTNNDTITIKMSDEIKELSK